MRWCTEKGGLTMLRESPFKHYNVHSLIKGMKSEYKQCAACAQAITDKYLLQIEDQLWHVQCLRCCICKLALDKSCYMKDHSIYCKQDYTKSFGAKCSKCSGGISATEWVRKAKNHVFHITCFACDVCKRQLSTGEEFALHEDRVLCKTHYLELVDGGTTSSDDGGDSEGYSKNKAKRVRTTFTEEQLQVLQANFQLDSNPDGQDLERIAQITGLSKRVTQVWFQNSRARQKKHLHTNKMKPTMNHNNNNIMGSETNYTRQINLHLTYSFQQQQHKTSPIYIPQHTASETSSLDELSQDSMLLCSMRGDGT